MHDGSIECCIPVDADADADADAGTNGLQHEVGEGTVVPPYLGQLEKTEESGPVTPPLLLSPSY